MNAAAKRMVIGIGSDHGDDAIGWHVVDRLEAMGIDDLIVAKTRDPLEILDLLDVRSGVHIVDAAVGMKDAVNVTRLRYANPADRALIRNVQTTGSHDAKLSFALSIADSLGKRTNHVTVWLGNGKQFEPFSQLSEIGRRSIECCFEAIAQELCHARNVTG